MVTIISISLALLVFVAGLLLLARTKKEDLGGLFTFSSYAVITCGILLAAYAFVGCLINCHSSKGRCGNSSYSQCYGSGYGGGNKCASYKKGCSKSGCSSYTQGGKHGYSKSSCSKGSHTCKKGGKCCSKSSGKKREIRKIIKIEGDGEEDVNVTLEITE